MISEERLIVNLMIFRVTIWEIYDVGSGIEYSNIESGIDYNLFYYPYDVKYLFELYQAFIENRYQEKPGICPIELLWQNGEFRVIGRSPESVIVPPEIYTNLVTAKINAEKGAALRKGPTDSYAEIVQIPFATEVLMRGHQSSDLNWINIIYEKDGAKYQGWIKLAELEQFAFVTDLVLPKYYFYFDYYKVNSKSGLRLRKGPSTNDPIILVMPYEGEVEVFGSMVSETQWEKDRKGWVYVNYAGSFGWTSMEYLKAESIQGDDD